MYRKPFCSRLDFDLVQAAKNVLDFLRQVDEYPADLYKGPFLKNAIRRYEVFWLPLAAKEGYIWEQISSSSTRHCLGVACTHVGAI